MVTINQILSRLHYLWLQLFNYCHGYIIYGYNLLIIVTVTSVTVAIY